MDDEQTFWLIEVEDVGVYGTIDRQVAIDCIQAIVISGVKDFSVKTYPFRRAELCKEDLSKWSF